MNQKKYKLQHLRTTMPISYQLEKRERDEKRLTDADRKNLQKYGVIIDPNLSEEEVQYLLNKHKAKFQCPYCHLSFRLNGTRRMHISEEHSILGRRRHGNH